MLSSTRLNSTQRRVVALTIAYALVSFLLQLFHQHRSFEDQGLFTVFHVLPPLMAGLWGLRYSRKQTQDGDSSPHASGWLLIALASLVWAAGQSLCAYYDLVLKVLPPIPCEADAFLLSAYALIFGGIYILFGPMPLPIRARLFLDSTIAVSGVGVASWYFLVRRLWHASYPSEWAKFVTVAYPLADVAALFGTMMLLQTMFRVRRPDRLQVSLVAAGTAIIAFTDTVATYVKLTDAYELGAAPALRWNLGWLVLGFAFAIPLWFPSKNAGEPDSEFNDGASSQTTRRKPVNVTAPVMRLLVPYAVAALICAEMMANDYMSYDRLHASTFAITFAIILIVIARQVITQVDNLELTRDLEDRLAENRRLTVQMRHFTEGLEMIVERRAQQLGALHQLTKAVHNTQQVDAVLTAASHNTSVAMHANAAFVWMVERNIGDDHDTFGLSRASFDEGVSPMVERFIHDFTPVVQDGSAAVPILDPRRLSDDSPAPIAELLYAPLRYRETVLGMIGVVRNVSESELLDGAFDQSDRDLLESIGLEVATALNHARQYAAVRDAADRDPVTNLFNHRAIHQHLDEEIAISVSQDAPLSVIMMDLNDFKIFNDTYGHPVGDHVLRLVAQTLKQENGDAICGRYGGDEFLVLLPRTTIEEATEFAERLRHRLIAEGFRNPAADDGKPIPIAISFGVSVCPDDAHQRHDLLALADSNLYKAKKSQSGISVTTSIQRVTNKLRNDSSFGILDAMVTSINNKDSYTRQHSEDVTKYALWLAQELRLSDENMHLIRVGGLLHDVGKIGIPEEILRKPGKLTPQEYEAVKQHPNLGAMIVSAVPGMENVIDGVRFHHERWDGKGYPDRLSGTDIPLLGRILAVADAFSAMTTDRPYRAGRDWLEALEEIERSMGTHFDPIMARAFCSVIGWRMQVTTPTTRALSASKDSDRDLPAVA